MLLQCDAQTLELSILEREKLNLDYVLRCATLIQVLLFDVVLKIVYMWVSHDILVLISIFY